jgi:hypothetical protein
MPRLHTAFCIAASCFFLTAAMAADKPNLTGTWKMNPAKSDLGSNAIKNSAWSYDASCLRKLRSCASWYCQYLRGVHVLQKGRRFRSDRDIILHAEIFAPLGVPDGNHCVGNHN